jgi:hypothetical protein
MSRCQIGPQLNEDLLCPQPGCEPDQCTDKAKHSVTIRTDDSRTKKHRIKLCDMHFYTLKMNCYEQGRTGNTLKVIENTKSDMPHVRIDIKFRENKI